MPYVLIHTGGWHTGRAWTLGIKKDHGISYQGSARLLEIARDRDLLAICVSLEFVEFRRFFFSVLLDGEISLGVSLANRRRE